MADRGKRKEMEHAEPFLAVLERSEPGTAEHLIAVVFVENGKTIWMDADGSQSDYDAIEPDTSRFSELQEAVSQGMRRFLAVEGCHFNEIVDALVRSGAAAPAYA
jgi:hypothetical protein